MTVRINLKKAERKVLPAADYLLEIAVSEQTTSKSGNPNLHLELLPDVDQHPEFEGARLFHDMSLLEKSWYRSVELLEAVGGGEGLEADNEEGDLEFEPEDFIGKKVGATVVVDDSYDGTARNKITGFFPVSDFEQGEAEESEEDPDAEAPKKAKK